LPNKAGDQKTFFYFFAKDAADRTVENRRPKKNRLRSAAEQTIFFWPPIFDCSICGVFSKKIKKSFLIAKGGARKIMIFQISIFGHFGHFCKKWKISIESEGGVGRNSAGRKKVPFLKAPTGIGSKIHGQGADFF